MQAPWRAHPRFDHTERFNEATASVQACTCLYAGQAVRFSPISLVSRGAGSAVSHVEMLRLATEQRIIARIVPPLDAGRISSQKPRSQSIGVCRFSPFLHHRCKPITVRRSVRTAAMVRSLFFTFRRGGATTGGDLA
jgi:hypothetical protein